MLTPEQTQKLPRYAQDEIAALRSLITRIEAENRQLRESHSGVKDSPVRIRSFPTHDMDFGLREDAQVRFQLGPDFQDYIDVYLSARSDNGIPRVHIHGGGMIHVHPQSGNVCEVSLSEPHSPHQEASP